MKKRTAIIGALVSLMPLGQPLVMGMGAVLTSAGMMFSVPEKAQAESAESIFKSAYKKMDRDYDGAIKGFTKFINAYPSNQNLSIAYYNRGLSKRKLGDNYGAISDYSKAIEINPRYATAYMNRGNAKYALKDNYGAISDYNKSIAIRPNDPNDVLAFRNRGVAKEELGDLQGACSDWREASSLGDESADQWVRNQCN